MLWLAIAHVVAFAVTETWLAAVQPDGWRWPAVAVAASWLLLGPLFIVLWERQVATLGNRLLVTASFSGRAGEDELVRLGRRADRWRPVVIAVPLVLIAPAPWSASNLADRLHLHGFVRLGVAELILCLGGVTAGFGLWAAVKTLVLTQAVAARDIDDGWNPLTGVAAPVSEALATFSFSSAVLFAAGGTTLLPGMLAGAFNSDGGASVLLVTIMAVIVAGVVSLLVLPAWFLSSRSRRHRDDYLQNIATAIERFTVGLVDGRSTIGERDYLTLRSLLELRHHVVAEASSPASVDLVKRIPLALILPLLSTGAAWLALI